MSESQAGNSVSLADLIRDHCARTGDSYSDLARASGLSKARIGQLAHVTDAPAQPRQETIEKLAKALRLPVRIVQAAAMVTAGVSPGDVGTDQRIALLAAQLADLDPVTLRYVEVCVGALLAEAGR